VFGRSFFGAAFWGPRYFGDGGDVAPVADTINTGAWYDYEPGERRRRGLEWDKRRDDLKERLEAAYAKIVGEVPAAEIAPVVALVKPFVEVSYDTKAPPAAAVDWAAFQRDVSAVEGLLAALRVVEEMDEEDAVTALLLA
jgi:hypothetical protein